VGLAGLKFGSDARNNDSRSGGNAFNGGGFPLSGLPADGASADRLKGNMVLDIPARVRGDSLIRGQPDGDVVMMKQGCDARQHIRCKEQPGRPALRCTAQKWRYVSGGDQGDRCVINIHVIITIVRGKGSLGGIASPLSPRPEGRADRGLNSPLIPACFCFNFLQYLRARENRKEPIAIPSPSVLTELWGGNLRVLGIHQTSWT
jgi:hypothetical protein